MQPYLERRHSGWLLILPDEKYQTEVCGAGSALDKALTALIAPSATGASEESVERAAKILAASPLIDAPKLPFPAWMGLARSILESAPVPVAPSEPMAACCELDGCIELRRSTSTVGKP